MYPKVRFRYIENKDKEDYLFLVGGLGDVKLNNSLWKAFLDEYEESNKEIWIGEVTDVNHGIMVVCTASLIHDFKAHNRFSVATYISDFIVHEKFRRLGIGSALMTHLLKQSVSMGAYETYFNGDSPKEFLNKFGFVDRKLVLNEIYSN